MLRHVILNAVFCGLGCVLAWRSSDRVEAILGAGFAAMNGAFVVIALLTANDLEPRG